jgi:hypothetical protein
MRQAYIFFTLRQSLKNSEHARTVRQRNHSHRKKQTRAYYMTFVNPNESNTTDAQKRAREIAALIAFEANMNGQLEQLSVRVSEVREQVRSTTQLVRETTNLTRDTIQSLQAIPRPCEGFLRFVERLCRYLGLIR